MSSRSYYLTVAVVLVVSAVRGADVRVGQTDCLVGVDEDHEISVTVRDCAVVVEHRGLVINCCIEYAPKVEITGFDIHVKDVDIGPPCDCLCPVELSVTISALPPGEYTVTHEAFGLAEPRVSTVTVPACEAPLIAAEEVWSPLGILGVLVMVEATHTGALEAFSFGLTFPLEHCTLRDIDFEGTLTQKVIAEYAVVEIDDDPAGVSAHGWATCSVVLDAEEPFDGHAIPPGAAQPIARLHYDLLMPGESVPRSISVPFVADLGPERVPVEFVLDGRAVTPERRSGIIQIVMPLPEFVRGDANDSGSVDITDAVFTLNYLFGSGAEPPCRDSADTDDDGRLRITDPIRTLVFLFSGGSIPPPSPLDGPGADRTLDALDCRRRLLDIR